MKRAVSTGIGCFALLPATLIGLAGLTDYMGPKGWTGFTEILGWIVVCVAAALLTCRTLMRLREVNLASAAAVLAISIGVCAFTGAVTWLGLDAPMSVRNALTVLLQVTGNVAFLGVVLLVAKAVYDQRMSSR